MPFTVGSLPTGPHSLTGLALMAVLSLWAGPVGAGWLALDKPSQPTERETVYFDPEQIQRSGTRATLWQLTDLQWNDITRFLSLKTQKEFDCQRTLVRVLQVIEFSRQMGTGRPRSGYIENGNWQTIGESGPDRALWKAACGKPEERIATSVPR